MKYGKKITNEIVGYISEGLSRDDARILVGIAESTFYEWMQKEEFSEAIKIAEVNFKQAHVKNITNWSKKQWTASAWMLERKFRDEFGNKTEIEHKGDVGINFTAKGIFIHSAIQPARSATESLGEPKKIQGDSVREAVGENHDSNQPVNTGESGQ